jgi:hypothetical protein
MKKAQVELDSPEQRFHKEVEKIVAGGADYLDAVIHWCERNGIEIEFAASLIKGNSTSKAKMLDTAKKLNFIDSSKKGRKK